ncbi:MAG: isoprenylcysteine carboxylmethyltransferase family protein [Candidatus Nanopelagicaceae bacterium]|nr:isoprenylcysteine carboxylmethyltransferase family protein [Candidatus Nanopelagicaceae bacterium]
MSLKSSKICRVDDLRKGRMIVALQFALIIALVIFPDDTQAQSWATITGIFLIGVGVIIIFIGFSGLGKSLTANPVPNQDSKLVTTGIYNLVRHPIYTGLLAATLGLVLSSGVWSQILLWLALVILLTYKLRWEEVMLSAKYKGYAEYKARVPAIFPRLTPSK